MTAPDFAALNPMPGLMGFGPRREPRPMPAPRSPAARPVPVEPPPTPQVAPPPAEPQDRPPAPSAVQSQEEPTAATVTRPRCRLPDSRFRSDLTPTLRDGALLALAVIGHVAPYEQIALRAWTLWPEVFGLVGHEHAYPDTQRVTCKLSTLRGMGLVFTTRDGWKLTRAGLARARLVAPAAGVDLAAGVML